MLRLVTYNIHKGIGGLDRRYRPERIVEVLSRIRADVCLLQEVDEGVPRSRFHRQVDLLGDALGYPHRAFFANHQLQQGHYGNALLSRVAFRGAHNLSLTLPYHKSRSALHARLDVDGPARGLWLFNVHLGLAEQERRQQVRRILRHIDDEHGQAEPRRDERGRDDGPRAPSRARALPDAPVVVMGDFNDVWVRLGPAVLFPEGFRSIQRPPRTFPAARPLRPLDRVFVRGRIEIAHCYRVNDDVARRASDHLPLVAELRLH